MAQGASQRLPCLGGQDSGRARGRCGEGHGGRTLRRRAYGGTVQGRAGGLQESQGSTLRSPDRVECREGGGCTGPDGTGVLMDATMLSALRKPFPKEEISRLAATPKRPAVD